MISFGMPDYQYTPLRTDPKEIRLIKLLPGEGSTPIQASIIQESLSPNQSYAALSYAWGSSELTHSISVSSQSQDAEPQSSAPPALPPPAPSPPPRAGVPRTLSITTNLAIALQHLRHPRDTLVLWIDAICINQNDLSERSKEVASMAYIYSHASRVIVWLGEESPTSSLAIKTIKSISRHVEQVNLEIYKTTTAREGSETFILERDHQASREKVLNWIAIRELIRRQWFSRLWILQEIAHASHAVIRVGSDEVNWEDFRAAVSWLCAHIPKTFISEIIDKGDWNRVRHLIRRFTVDGKSTETLERLLTMTKYQVCLDPRDRIYAILSLACGEDEIGIEPNYSIDTGEVYRDFVLRYIEHTRTLRLFSFCRMRNGRPSLVLPSWVPDFSVPDLLQDFPYLRNATGCSEQQSSYDPATISLKVCGVVVGRIKNVSSVISNTARLPEILALCKTWAPKQEFYTAEYVAGGSLIDAFVSTLVCGLCGPPEVTSGGQGLSLEGSRAAFEECVMRGGVGIMGSDVQKYTYLLERYLPGQAFFETEIGTGTGIETGYFGLCPAGTQPGDQVVVILGCNSPCVIRPRTDEQGSYNLIGPCYGHGLMNAEALLGPLPDDWRISGVYNRGVSYACGDGCDTFDDPRSGDLPPGWKTRPGNLQNMTSESMAPTCGLRTLLFECLDTGEVTRFDPRLTCDALTERGVNVSNFILI